MTPIIISAISGLVQILVLILIARALGRRWRSLDSATRAAHHASEQQRIQLAKLAHARAYAELDNLSQAILGEAQRRVQAEAFAKP
jgi:hypothetical protein